MAQSRGQVAADENRSALRRDLAERTDHVATVTHEGGHVLCRGVGEWPALGQPEQVSDPVAPGGVVALNGNGGAQVWREVGGVDSGYRRPYDIDGLAKSPSASAHAIARSTSPVSRRRSRSRT